jgi:hypothetical protein
MTTVPGFSSRDTSTTVRQLPQRDEAVMTTPGFSNSKSDHESRTVTTEAPAAVVAVAETKVVDAPEPKKTARKVKAEGK